MASGDSVLTATPMIPKSSAELKDLHGELKGVHALRAESTLGFA